MLKLFILLHFYSFKNKFSEYISYKHLQPDKDTMRSFRYHAGYDLTFTLMVPEPEQMNVDWTIEQGIEG